MESGLKRRHPGKHFISLPEASIMKKLLFTAPKKQTILCEKQTFQQKSQVERSENSQ